MSDGERRGLRIPATLVFIGLPLVVLALTALNVVRALEVGDTLALREAELAPLERRLARDGTAPGVLDDTEAVWLPGDSPSLAAALLQQRLVDLISATSSRVVEVQGLDAGRSDADANDVVLRITYDATNTGLLATLHAIETGLPLIEVMELSIAQAGAATSGEDPLLRIDLTVRGYRKETD